MIEIVGRESHIWQKGPACVAKKVRRHDAVLMEIFYAELSSYAVESTDGTVGNREETALGIIFSA